MKTLRGITFAATLNLLFASALAQPSPYVLEHYDLTQLDARPGQVLVSPDVLTLLEFDDQVIDVSTARPDAMTIEVIGNMVRLRSNWREGSTDLVVTVANRTALFTVETEPEGVTSRRYLIERPDPTLSMSSSTEFSSKKSVTVEPAETSNLPEWLSVSFNILSAPGEETVIQYGIRNLGEHDIINDANRLSIVQAGYKTPFKLERINTSGTVNRIQPGMAEYGTLLIRDPLPGKLSLVWDLVEVGPGNSYTLREDFYEGLVRP